MKTHNSKRHMKSQLKKSFAAYDLITDKANKILQHYVCPPECNAICCKDGVICIEKKEYFKIIDKVNSESKAIIEQPSRRLPSVESTNFKKYGKAVVRLIEDNSDFVYLLPPCPLLNNSGKCNIYSNRPAVCKRYPFEFYHFDKLEDTENIIVMLKICALSKDVILDYGCWQILIQGVHFEDILQSIKDFYHNNMPISVLIIPNPIQTLTEWAEHLENKSPEIRLLQRDILLNFIQRKLNEVIKEPDISELALELIQCGRTIDE